MGHLPTSYQRLLPIGGESDRHACRDLCELVVDVRAVTKILVKS
jgi:hypothetical protein